MSKYGIPHNMLPIVTLSKSENLTKKNNKTDSGSEPTQNRYQEIQPRFVFLCHTVWHL